MLASLLAKILRLYKGKYTDKRRLCPEFVNPRRAPPTKIADRPGQNGPGLFFAASGRAPVPVRRDVVDPGIRIRSPDLLEEKADEGPAVRRGGCLRPDRLPARCRLAGQISGDEADIVAERDGALLEDPFRTDVLSAARELETIGSAELVFGN